MHRTAIGSVLAAALLLMPAASAFAAYDPTQPFAEAWSRLPGSRGWTLLVSIPFPRDWPPALGRQGMDVVRYAYAMRLRPGLADGAEMAAPWARSTETPDGAVTVTVLATELQPLGIQGVRPLSAAELDLAGRESEAARLLQAGAADATNPLVRAATCGWIARNGVVAAAITPLHQAFTRWLACGDTAGPPAASATMLR